MTHAETEPQLDARPTMVDFEATGRQTSLRPASVVAVVALTYLTFGLYVPIWFLRRRSALNSLDTETRLNVWGPLCLLLFRSLEILLSLVVGALESEGATRPLELQLIDRLTTLAAVGCLLALSFRVRSMLMDALQKRFEAVLPGNSFSMQSLFGISGPLTFFLNIWYLQYKINDYLKVSQQWESFTPDDLVRSFPPRLHDPQVQ